jgi:hypothetical protein
MQNTKIRIALASVFAMLLYLGPNLVQDVHRIAGHQIHFGETHNQPGVQLYSLQEECAVCVFEFNIVDESKTFAFVPVFNVEKLILETLTKSQIHTIYFSYYNLRGPPVA